MRGPGLVIVEKCNEIIADYQAQNLRLTLRQLYYQLVSKNIIPNVERSYKNLSSTVSDARLSGRMDWDAIEDRARQPSMAIEFENIQDLADWSLRVFRLPRWVGQENYVELWVEKDALAGVLAPLARKYHICLMVNRGYSSQSAMYESAQRFKENMFKLNVSEAHLLYLGDFDPSGEDMVRDIRDRLELFEVGDLSVHKIALTMDQIEEHDPPPNPAKMSDPRAAKFVDQHGAESWEVDALPPNVLQTIIEANIQAYIDLDKYNAVIEKEKQDAEAMRKHVKKIK